MKFVSLFPVAFAALTPIASNAQTRGGDGNSIAARRLMYEKIAGYQPKSQVTDHNAIDLDQASMETQIADATVDSFAAALKIFTEGGHSKSYAEVTVPGLTSVIKKKTLMSVTSNGITINGKAYGDSEGEILYFQYATGDMQASYVGCQVGGLPVGKHNLKGCLPSVGEVVVGAETYAYSYNQNTDNKNGRTINKFSTSAQEKMGDCTSCPYTEYNKFRIYYGVPDYASHWVTKALKGEKTEFPGPSGKPDFSSYSFVGRGEAAKKGSAYMAVYMYVIREFEDAIDDCKKNCINCNDDPVHAWDEGVAFYTGSMEGQTGAFSGKLLHALADKGCRDYATCGAEGGSRTGISKLNHDLVDLFTLGQQHLLQGECDAAKSTKNDIVSMMAIPLVQGTLRYAYKVDKLTKGEKEKAEGAVFAAAVLPILHDCDEDAAKVVSDNMMVGASSTNYAAVKAAFEGQYECMKITCADIGALMLTDSEVYEGAESCAPVSTSSHTSSSLSKGLAIGLGVTAAFFGIF
eukprot:CAMPEP_0197840238 /NCGR_PEP_ID=MMETSP1437-20131217/45490_1 /TAXON_ID=49252 ORGANISM="Eucampia antarctica, Strain CCMP1452" /NCGR_SAMPLE_ID=MMETSP1437 /ASSEMBLY_ACC=CAM_ASM_001096 /LENGTH=518 /DNA_ID=CAMNT_0043449817 /DNA_START=158 /DNA_END=1714 /DNA_ORIENTATION=-